MRLRLFKTSPEGFVFPGQRAINRLPRRSRAAHRTPSPSWENPAIVRVVLLMAKPLSGSMLPELNVLITPPVGFNLFVIQSLTKRDILYISTAAFPFFVLLLIATARIVIWPEIVLFLPNAMLNRG